MDGADITPDEIYAWSDANEDTPKTSAVGFEDAEKVMKQIVDTQDEMIIFTISGKMSTTVNVFRMAADSLGIEDKVSVIDTGNLSTGVGMLVIEAAEMSLEGKTREEICQRIESLKEKEKVSFVVDTLTYLHRGGRCSSVAALAGGVLKLHPKIVVSEGSMKADKKFRGKTEKAILEYVKELEGIRKSGFVRVRIDSITYDLSESIKLEKNKKHNIEVVVDRLVVKESIKSRLADSIETATKLADGLLIVDVIGKEEIMFSLNYACPDHGVSIGEITPRMFSFNSPFGSCKKCSGLGVFMEISPEMIIPDRKLSLRQGAIKASGWGSKDENSIAGMYYTALGNKFGFDLDTPIEDFSYEAYEALLFGTKGEKLKMERTTSYGSGTYFAEFEGILNNVQRRYTETSSEASRKEIEALMTTDKCNECGGARLSKEALSVTVCGLNIYEVCSMSISESLAFAKELPEKLTEREKIIANLIIKEIVERLSFLSC